MNILPSPCVSHALFLIISTIITGEWQASVVNEFHISHITVIRYTNVLYHFLLGL